MSRSGVNGGGGRRMSEDRERRCRCDIKTRQLAPETGNTCLLSVQTQKDGTVRRLKKADLILCRPCIHHYADAAAGGNGSQCTRNVAHLVKDAQTESTSPVH